MVPTETKPLLIGVPSDWISSLLLKLLKVTVPAGQIIFVKNNKMGVTKPFLRGQ